MRWLASPTSAFLLGGLALTGAGIFGVAWGAWLAAPGLALVGLVVAKEALLWRWRRSRDTEALAAERGRVEKAMAEAVGNERSRSQRALAEALAAERGRAEKTIAEAIQSERNRRSLVDVHLADRGLPIRRILLLFTIHRSGSTWLFDMLRTHPAVRVEPTTRVWTALSMNGGRYPGAFHHADGASVPLEITPGWAAAIPAFPPAAIPKGGFEEAERWALEKAHPEFVGFEASRLAARVRDLRGNGVAVEIVYGVRCPLDVMWSMAEYKSRDPKWYKKLPVGEIPRFIARSFEVLAEARALLGGSIIEYENLPDDAALNRLALRLAPGRGGGEGVARSRGVRDRALETRTTARRRVSRRARPRARPGWPGRSMGRRRRPRSSEGGAPAPRRRGMREINQCGPSVEEAHNLLDAYPGCLVVSN